MIEKIMMRRSNRGVPHYLVVMEGITFSICYMSSKKGDDMGIYRIWDYDSQNKLLDVPMQKGGSVNMEFVLSALVEKAHELRHREANVR